MTTMTNPMRPNATTSRLSVLGASSRPIKSRVVSLPSTGCAFRVMSQAPTMTANPRTILIRLLMIVMAFSAAMFVLRMGLDWSRKIKGGAHDFPVL